MQDINGLTEHSTSLPVNDGGGVGGGDDEFGGLGGGGGLDDEDPLADAPPGIGWGKKLVAGIVVTLLCYSAWSAKNVLGDIFFLRCR